VQERRGAVMHFENVGGRFVWRSDRFLALDVGEWFRFVDLDSDGLVDLLGESPISLIRAWRNVGTRTAPAFRVAADTLRDSDGTPIAADRQNILNLVDIDCNGRLDLFLGRVTGTIDRFEAVPGGARDGVPRFAIHTERFEGIEILGNVPGQPSRTEIGGTRHGANTMAFGDVDGDGDSDLFWGDYFEQGLLLIENRSTGCTTPAMQERPRRFPDDSALLTSGYNAPAIGDVDGDGLPDLVMGVIGGAFTPRRTSVANLHLVRQVARGRFEAVTDRLIRTVDVGSDAVPHLADLDGDGDIDLLVGNRIAPQSDTTAMLTWFENTGTRTAPELRARGPLPMRGEYHYAPAVVDLDGDGRPDLALGTWRDKVQWWRNTGTVGAPRYELADSALVTLTRGSNTTPAFADLDGDGDPDLVVGEASGQLNLYRNEGAVTAPRFVLVTDTLEGIDVGRRSTPTFADLDGDGAVELVVGSEDGGLQRWRTVREGDWVRFVREEAVRVETYTYSTPAFGDLHGDGRPDLVVGTASGGLLWFGAQEFARDSLPTPRIAWELVRVPGGEVTIPGPDGPVRRQVPAFDLLRTEVPWELYDVFSLRLDVPRDSRSAVDATTRPSRPYGAPDRGFGHRGYAAISLTHASAVRFAAWLSARTGHSYAVATEAQWQRAADLAFAGIAPSAYVEHAWIAANAEGAPHPIATRAPDRLGLHDLLGNVGEWVTTEDGTGVLRGGSYLTMRDALSVTSRERQLPTWNSTDPQDPKSRWWLSDGPFAGFRLVRIPSTP
jgi:formylglycine-generating enzyme required for sulfatase activity